MGIGIKPWPGFQQVPPLEQVCRQSVTYSGQTVLKVVLLGQIKNVDFNRLFARTFEGLSFNSLDQWRAWLIGGWKFARIGLCDQQCDQGKWRSSVCLLSFQVNY